ncbi:MAG: TonB-dependent receptor, partial [Akkermansiaceae bacterium]|nr:TonB-dependent receptor [Verrucomicrobiales bacterium]
MSVLIHHARRAGVGVVLAIAFLGSQVWAQSGLDAGSIAGTIHNNYNGEPLPGITVTVRGTTLAAVTDATGRFSMAGLPPGEYVVSFSKPGFERSVVAQVRILAGQVSPVNARLNPEFYEMDEYEVLAEDLDERPEGVLLEQRKDSSSFMEAISADRFSRLAAGDAGEIMTKVTGVAVVDGKFAVVRGLSDRYNITLLNGGEVPTADPYRRSVQLDLFPSDVIANVAVSKTFTPDMPGGFGGSVMNIVTKSFPEKRVFKVSVGLGYNSQATFNDKYLTYQGGSLDAFGMDDGTRAMPSDVANANLAKLLDDASKLNRTGSPTPEEKTAAAIELHRLTHAFGTPDMGPTTGTAPPDHDFSMLLGDTLKLGENPLGYFVGVNYERDYRFYENGIQARYFPGAVGQSPRPDPIRYMSDTRSETKAQWSGLVNLAYRLADQHEIAFNFLYSQVGEDSGRRLVGKYKGSTDQFAPGNTDLTYRSRLYFVERNLTSYQLKGSHEIEPLGLLVDWLGSTASTYQDEPDLRYFNLISYDLDPSDPNERVRSIETGQNNIPSPAEPIRYFRLLEDQNLNGKLDLTFPIEDGRGLEWKLKSGVFASRSEREFNERAFYYRGRNVYTNDPTTFPHDFLDDENALPPILGSNPARGQYVFDRIIAGGLLDTSYSGKQNIDAFYGMVEIPVLSSVRLVGGARYEKTYLAVSTNVINQADILPAVNLTWNFGPDMNVRASYAETVARPTYRELALYQSYDLFTDDTIVGNKFLEMSSLRNLDLRWEWFTSRGGLLSVGSFYKTIQKPIERVNGVVDPDGVLNLGDDYVTYINGEPATLWGIEFETRQNLGILDSLLDVFSVGLNFAWINSETKNHVKIYEKKLEVTGRQEPTRPLYDQSPYILNVDLSYDNDRSGTAVTLAFYYAAERLALVDNNYDIYEQGAPQLDLVISQKLSKNCKL